MRAGKRTISSLFICRQQSFQISRVQAFNVPIVGRNTNRPLRLLGRIRKFLKCTYEALIASLTRRLEFDRTKPCWDGSLAKSIKSCSIMKIIEWCVTVHWAISFYIQILEFNLALRVWVWRAPQQVKCLTKLKIFRTPLENPISTFKFNSQILNFDFSAETSIWMKI